MSSSVGLCVDPALNKFVTVLKLKSQPSRNKYWSEKCMKLRCITTDYLHMVMGTVIELVLYVTVSVTVFALL